MGSRRRARELAFKGLYGYALREEEPEKIVLELVHGEPQDVVDFALSLVKKAHENINLIDEKIKNVLENWDFGRLAETDRAILRLAVSDFLFFPEIPPKVTIDEAIELSKRYSTHDSSRFVNGVLDRIAKLEGLL